MVSTGGGFSTSWILNTIKMRLFDIFSQEWRSATWANRICTNYRMFKDDLKVPRNPSNLAFICTQIGLIHDILSFFVCKLHYFKK